jgi:hypothetical protein
VFAGEAVSPRMSDSRWRKLGTVTWPIIFLLVVLKIPIVYLCAVVWWAIRAEPEPDVPDAPVTVGVPAPRGPHWRLSTRKAARRPGGGPVRRPAGRGPAVRAYARR